MAKKSKRRTGEFEGAQCGRCGLPLDPHGGTCPNKKCPFYWGFQDEVVTNDQWPSEEEWLYIEKLRVQMGLPSSGE